MITIFGAIHASRGVRQSTLQLSEQGGLEGSLRFLSLLGSNPLLRVAPRALSLGGGVSVELEVRF